MFGTLTGRRHQRGSRQYQTIAVAMQWRQAAAALVGDEPNRKKKLMATRIVMLRGLDELGGPHS